MKPEITVLENGELSAEFVNGSGTIRSIALKGYRQTIGKQAPAVFSVGGEGGVALIPEWKLYSEDGQTEIPRVFRFKEKLANKVIFASVNDDGLYVEKSFTLPSFGFLIDSEISISNLNRETTALTSKISFENPVPSKNSNGFFSFLAPQNTTSTMVNLLGKIDRTPLTSLVLGEAKRIEGSTLWAGIGDRYFANLIVPVRTELKDATFLRDSSSKVFFQLSHLPKKIGPQEKADIAFQIYSGPLEINYLSLGGDELEKAIDLGDWLGPIARPMLKFMKAIYGFLGNYGIAIIILTILVKLLLFPLNQKQVKSMKGMQALQPELADIKEKFKGNKERLNLEMMNLFKRNKVNPMSGCLPMLIQFPIFIALYRVLYNSIELRHAPFMLWIQDLSAPDPYYISPVIMGATMFLQQQMMPMTTMDPAQAKMMKLMPIIFSLFMIMLPSGLVIYIFVNSLLSILQQWIQTRSYKNITAAKGVA
jgi:YidC/Oxa1 family membrane protein insertase